MTAARIVAAGSLVVVAALEAGRRASGSERRLRALDPQRRSAMPLVRVTALLAGAAVALIVGGWVGVLAGVSLAFAVDYGLRRLPSGASHQERLRAAADLPLAADLLAAALRAGAPVDRAATAVGTAIGGPLGVRLVRVGRALRLGAAPDEAWRYLTDVAEADRVVRAAVRSSVSGAALAGSLSRLADDLRSARATAADAAARRAGVLVVLPLGLCFLPAFVLAGLVPVIVSVLDDVW
jgi:Flp pilus assembly protein TadB